ncbi:MAG TPA: MBL fold metallo-hydrolase [Anaerolineae bacterium]|nr:MBL fold metallo-hydrolase [Anaerolineae bacterium]
MLLKYFYDKALAHASYMVGCQRTGEALIVDPGRDIDGYLAAAEAEGMTLVGMAETHIHADYVSGARELAERIGAKLYVSDEGPEDWKYFYAHDYDAVYLKDGDTFTIGNIKFEVMHTPGHTPESISFILTDMGGGADRPMGIFTGDFVFVGSVGRPDLLEKAAGVAGTADSGARDMFKSVERFKALPDYLQVWPAHGAGSACGKGLGAIPSSTVGYEKMFNPAMAYDDEEAFVNYLLADQPEPPTYFAVMKRVNKEGPMVLGEAGLPMQLAPTAMSEILSAGHLVIDTRSADEFAAAHVPGTINVPPNYLAHWAGWFIDYDKPVYLISSEGLLAEMVRVLRKIGVDRFGGYWLAAAVAEAGLNSEDYEVRSATELADAVLNQEVMVIDVRGAVEWNEGRLPNAEHLFLGGLLAKGKEAINGKPVVVQCRTGGRSAIGASILQAAGASKVINMAGGITEWAEAGLPVEEA